MGAGLLVGGYVPLIVGFLNDTYGTTDGVEMGESVPPTTGDAVGRPPTMDDAAGRPLMTGDSVGSVPLTLGEVVGTGAPKTTRLVKYRSWKHRQQIINYIFIPPTAVLHLLTTAAIVW